MGLWNDVHLARHVPRFDGACSNHRTLNTETTYQTTHCHNALKHDPNRYSLYENCTCFLMDLPVAENAGVALTKSRNATATHMAREVVIRTAIRYHNRTTNHLALRHCTDERQLCKSLLYTAPCSLGTPQTHSRAPSSIRTFSLTQWQHLRLGARWQLNCCGDETVFGGGTENVRTLVNKQSFVMASFLF
jgi:hypothetical protein